MFRSIIVPLDGSMFGDYALPFGAALARRTGATLKLVHVHKPYMPGEALEALPHYQYQNIAGYDEHADESARRGEMKRIVDLADAFVKEGIGATGSVMAGPVAETIAEYAAGSTESVIVMSTHGRSGFGKLRLGSVADAVVRRSSTPVLLVRPPATGSAPPKAIDFERVLVPIDGSAFSTSIIGAVTSMAGTAPATITFFEAMPPAEDAAAAWSPIWPEGRAAASVLASDEFLAELQREFPRNIQMKETRRVISGHPAEAILQEAESGDYDLIAMATHGQSGARNLLLGSIAAKVMRGTEKPILLFRPGGRVPEASRETSVEEPTVQSVTTE